MVGLGRVIYHVALGGVAIGKDGQRCRAALYTFTRSFYEDNAVSKSMDPTPYYGRHVFCCVNERSDDDPRGCCKARGSVDLRDYMKRRAREMKVKGTRINQSLCLDRCELGPTMVIYPEGIWYTYRTEADVDEIIETHLLAGGRVERLLLYPEQREPRWLDGALDGAAASD